jgi:hypothetical protein
MSIFSIVAAAALYFPLGEMYGQTTFDCIEGDIVFYFVVILNIYFNYYCLSYVVDKQELGKVFMADIIILLILGYIQFLIIKGVSSLVPLYSALSQIFQLFDVTGRRESVTFFGSEPASADELLFIIIPFLFSSLMVGNLNTRRKLKTTFLLLLFVPLFLCSTSSSVYSTAIIALVTMLLLATRKEKYYKWIIVAGSIGGILLFIVYGTDIINSLRNTFQFGTLSYIIFYKAFDTSNLSTAMRFSTMKNSIQIFLKSPLFGIGNGIQGYFYAKNLQPWAYASSEVQYILAGKKGIINGGGGFYPAFLSGYGLVGVFFLLRFIKPWIKQLRCKAMQLGYLYLIFLIGMAIFNFGAWSVMGIKQNLQVSFLLSIPFIEERPSSIPPDEPERLSTNTN